MPNNIPQQYVDASAHTINHRAEIERSTLCGCYYCCSAFVPSDIHEWVTDAGGDEFAMCPRCGIDAVIGDVSGYPISKDFLLQMNLYWFDGEVITINDGRASNTDMLNPYRKCKNCKGSGLIPGIRKIQSMGTGMGSAYGPCPDCDGLGWIDPSDTVGDIRI